ncbi:transporter [Sphingomonas sp. ABOLD]|uniref:Multidrug efflux system outer membrane protein n=1 Tax=Sphingomonas trueperi TaxID=53317 RepID=A0A7X5XZ99_9SPHN|nr:MULTISPECIES: efflux transporter outer membrane subunit [Sphingomonas]NJB98141.1 multidrug efflux system outer membrane protein [Sphingomonas trueperi]RSV42308.1 transporter [Sphingomonas sp. ABOLE]RSV46375.1 transporter [Sphingomonas sp. ABOLD]
MKRALTLLTTAALAGCSMAPKDVRPAAPVPPSWPVGDSYLRESEATLPALSWREVFRDARLQTLIEQALVNNRDLRVAAANIAAARAQYQIQRGAQLPQVDASLGITERRGNVTNVGNGLGTGNTGNTGNTGGNVGNVGGGVRTNYSTQAGITGFELDLFGRLASLTRAQQETYFATEAGARATRLTLVGDIATAWLTYASDASLLAVAQQTAKSAEDSVRLTRARLEGGVAPRTDLRQAEQTLATAQNDVARQTSALAQDVNALRLLAGSEIDPALLPASIEEAAPTIAAVPAGLDSSILLRRPDVVQAEYQLRAANAQIGAARAALFPRISLTTVLGFASTALSSLFDGDAFTWQAGGTGSYSIFRGGAARANVRLTEAQQQAQLANYERAIQTAFRDVANALAVRGTIDAQLRATQLQEEAAADTYRLSEARYRGGIDTFLQSLVSQRSLYAAQQQLVTVQFTAATNRVNLYRALGGDSQLEVTRQGPQPVNAQGPAGSTGG